MRIEDAVDEPFAAWPWRRPEGRERRPVVSPPLDPRMEKVERERGLVARVLHRWAALVPEILGPLRRAPWLRPLSLEGGRLVAIDVARGAELGPWMERLADVEHVQTGDPAVCAALADGRRSFDVYTPEAERAALAGTPRDLVRLLDFSGAEDVPPPHGAPFVDEGFLPLAQLAEDVWLCWDRDEDRPAAVIVGEDTGYDARPGARRLTPSFGPVGPLPHRVYTSPSAPHAHLAAAGEGWAAAVSLREQHDMDSPRLVASPGHRWELVMPFRVKTFSWVDEWASWRRHHPERPVTERLEGTRWEGSAASIEIVDRRFAKVRWAGVHEVYLLRDGALRRVTVAHTLERQIAEGGEGYPGFEADPGFFSRVLVRGIGGDPEEALIPLLPGDALLVCTQATARALGEAALARMMAKGPRRGANEAQLALWGAALRDVVLFLTPESTSAESHPGWLAGRTVSLVPFEGDEDRKAAERAPAPGALPPSWQRRDQGSGEREPTPPHAGFQCWGLFRGHAMEGAPSFPPPARWMEALLPAVQKLPVAPEKGDVFRAWVGFHSAFQLQFDGESWLPMSSWFRPVERLVADGRLAFPEDAPPPRMEIALRLALDWKLDAPELAQIALEEGLPDLSLWLRLQADHWRGLPAAGLLSARERVSLRVRDRLSRARIGAGWQPHLVDVATLREWSALYDGCLVRYRSLVSEGPENMYTAGAWWEPQPPGEALPHRRYFAEVEAAWQHRRDGGFGHMSLSVTKAMGKASPVPIPDEPRRVTAEDLRRGRVRQGVPVRVELIVDVDRHRWIWEGKWLFRPLDWPLEEKRRIRADLIVAVVEEITLVKVLSREDVPDAPPPPPSSND